jgi:hypothetical protein
MPSVAQLFDHGLTHAAKPNPANGMCGLIGLISHFFLTFSS